jgi:hypothetical protein
MKSHAETGAAMVIKVFITFIRLLYCGKTGILAHRPESAPVTVSNNITRERIFTWQF